jgi:hypothetical protein
MNLQELLWKYVEGNCTENEISQVENLLSKNSEAAKELEQILAVHSTLKAIEPEKPSMRFLKNVMEALPDIYPAAAYDSILQSFWKKLGIGVIIFICAGIFLSQKNGYGSQVNSFWNFSPYVEKFNQLFDMLPPTFTQYFVLIMFSAGLLAAFDLLLKRTRIAH